jgi:hypothetical protein
MTDFLKELQDTAGVTQKTIDNKIYTIELFTTTKGIQIAAEIFKLIGPSAGNMVDSMKAEAEFSLDNQYIFTTVIQLLVDRLGEADVAAFVQALVSGVQCNGKPIDYETHFRGNYPLLVELIIWTLQENYKGSFTSLLKKMMPELEGVDLKTLFLSKNEKTPTDTDSEQSES